MTLWNSDFMTRLTKSRLKLSLILVLFYAVHKMFDMHDKPFSFDNDLIGMIGFLVVLAGLLLRSWAAGIIMKNKKLTTVGPYSLWRHPLYIGSFFLAAGFCIILNDWFLWPAVIALSSLVYYPKIKMEEEKLSRLFKEEWASYQKRTGIIFWRSLNMNEIFCGWSFRKWLHHKEYNAWLAVIAVLTLIEIWHHYL